MLKVEDLHFMKLAIEQANLSKPIETAYCVGAVRNCIGIKEIEIWTSHNYRIFFIHRYW